MADQNTPATAVIIGQGYVGLPLAQAASAAGVKVYGFDITQSLVDQLNAGVSHIDDLSDSDVQTMLSQAMKPPQTLP